MLAESYWSGNFLTEMWRVNESLPKFLVDLARRRYGSLQGKRVAVLGYTFKSDADDTRDSLAPKLIRYLARELPAEIVVTDPFISAAQVERSGEVRFTADLDAALASAQLVFVATNHSLYARESRKIIQAAKSGARVVDIWNTCGLDRVSFDRDTLPADSPIHLHRRAA
jgi:UDP-N-acetyl-D-mannosaminuronate dehydrogenase